MVIRLLGLLIAAPGGLVSNSGPPQPLEQASRAEQNIDGFPLILDGQPILVVRRGLAAFTAEERAYTVTRRLKRIASDGTISLDDLRIQEIPEDGSLYLRLGQDLLLTITERDAQASHLALALKHGARLITADKQLAKAALSLGCLADPAFPE